jgi:hypothetical protein
MPDGKEKPTPIGSSGRKVPEQRQRGLNQSQRRRTYLPRPRAAGKNRRLLEAFKPAAAFSYRRPLVALAIFHSATNISTEEMMINLQVYGAIMENG